MTVAIKAVIVFVLILLIKNKLIELIAIQAINVTIIGFALSSVMIRIVNMMIKKLRNNEKKDLAPFFPPIVIIKVPNITVNKNRTFIV